MEKSMLDDILTAPCPETHAALARLVLPQPGGPCSSIPCGDFKPSRLNARGCSIGQSILCFNKSFTSCSVASELIAAPEHMRLTGSRCKRTGQNVMHDVFNSPREIQCCHRVFMPLGRKHCCSPLQAIQPPPAKSNLCMTELTRTSHLIAKQVFKYSSRRIIFGRTTNGRSNSVH